LEVGLVNDDAHFFFGLQVVDAADKRRQQEKDRKAREVAETKQKAAEAETVRVQKAKDAEIAHLQKEAEEERKTQAAEISRLKAQLGRQG